MWLQWCADPKGNQGENEVRHANQQKCVSGLQTPKTPCFTTSKVKLPTSTVILLMIRSY